MRVFDHDRLTPEQFLKGLEDAGIGQNEFCELTGAIHQNVRLWLKPVDDPKHREPPFWVTSWLALYMLPHSSVVAAQVRDAFIYEPEPDEKSDAA